MIAEITRALWDFWAQFSINGTPIPAFQSGGVPDGQEFPYITFEAPMADAMETLPLAAHCWLRDPDLSQTAAQRIAFFQAVEQAIPQEGVMLPLPVGFLMIRRGSGDFLYPGTDADDRTVLYGRVGYEVTYYTK